MLNWLLLLLINVSVAKDLNGDPFMPPSGALFPEESAGFDQLNSLHTRSTASLKGPFFKWQIQSPKDDFKKLLEVYPGNLDYKTNIFDIEDAGLSRGQSKFGFWSYHYFPIYKGGIAQRYLSPIFAEGEDWPLLYKAYLTSPPALLISNENSEILSPIEKYEYLVGNTTFSMTDKQWQEGLIAKNRYGIIPTWYGTCHGTAPASLRVPRPEKSIVLRSFDNKNNITFYPSDIKALAAYAWATSASESAMIGTRCEEVILPSGRPSPSCNDVNPGAFHLAVTNLLGLHGQPFIIDTAESIQIWNRPLLSYKMSYFRPDTNFLTQNLKSAILPREKFTKDPFKLYRAPNATAMVGVWVELTFGAGIPASAATINSEADDTTVKNTYWYDLELDSKGEIVGGEWHEIFHPDFIWVVSPQVKPYTIYDRQMGSGLNTYDGLKPLDKNISELAKKSSTTGEILFTVIEKLVQLSRQ